VQTEFYIPPWFDPDEVKNEFFKDINQKKADLGMPKKKKLQIQPGETPEMVRARVGDAPSRGGTPKMW
jgi:hypothetical protein